MLQIIDVVKESKKGIVAARNGVAVYSENKRLIDYFSSTLEQYILNYVNCDEIKVQTFVLKEKHDAVIIIGDLQHTYEECNILSDIFERVGIKADSKMIFSIVGIDPNNEYKKNLFNNDILLEFSQSITNHCVYRTPSENLLVVERTKSHIEYKWVSLSTFVIFSACIIVLDILLAIPFNNNLFLFGIIGLIPAIFLLFSMMMIRNGNFSAINIFRIASTQAIKIMMAAVATLIILQCAIPFMLHVTQLVVHW